MTALLVAQKPLFLESWNLESVPAGKDLERWFMPISWFPADVTDPESLKDWVKVTQLSGARASP